MTKRLLATALCWLALLGTAGADPTVVHFSVKPGGGTVTDVQSGEVASVGPGAVGMCEFQADNSSPHSYRVQRSPFDPLDFTLKWEPSSGQWRCKTLVKDTLLTPETILGLSRTIRLNVSPAGAQAFTAALVQGGRDSDTTINVSGAHIRVTPLSQTNGMATIPEAWHPETVYLLRKGFDPYVLQIPEGALDTPSASYPAETVSLRPLYGPFSYPTFNVALVLFTGVAVAGWYRLVRPHQLERLRQSEVERQVGAEVLAGRPRGDMETRPGGLTRTVVTAESGTRYLLLKLLGEGGMGVVYEGIVVGAGEDGKVAVKMLVNSGTDAISRQRFLREVRICESLQHPSIVKVMDWGFWQSGATPKGEATAERKGPTPFMIMELLSGKNLRQILVERGGAVPPHIVTDYLIQTLQGLRLAHAAGIIHRDIKPENLMVTRGGRIKIMDFGVAHDAKDSMTKTNQGIGTPLYMSPEHFNAGKVCPASDIYSLGMVAFELLAGHAPYSEEDSSGDVWAMLALILTQPVPNLKEVNPRIPTALADIISRMMDRDLERRFPDCLAVLEALKSTFGGADAESTVSPHASAEDADGVRQDALESPLENP